MRARSSFALLALALVAGGCYGPGAVHALRTDAGRPLETPDGDAFLVWHDAGGWHLRARAEHPQRFHGVVEADDVRGVSAVGVPADGVRAGDDAIAFSFVAGGAAEAGFDWQGGGCPSFALYVDDTARNLRVFAGRYGASPARFPFTICR